jgi:hypothetical protein
MSREIVRPKPPTAISTPHNTGHSASSNQMQPKTPSLDEAQTSPNPCQVLSLLPPYPSNQIQRRTLLPDSGSNISKLVPKYTKSDLQLRIKNLQTRRISPQSKEKAKSVSQPPAHSSTNRQLLYTTPHHSKTPLQTLNHPRRSTASPNVSSSLSLSPPRTSSCTHALGRYRFHLRFPPTSIACPPPAKPSQYRPAPPPPPPPPPPVCQTAACNSEIAGRRRALSTLRLGIGCPARLLCSAPPSACLLSSSLVLRLSESVGKSMCV